MELLVVNPNSTASMTETIRLGTQRVARPNTKIVAVGSASGPPSIQGYYDGAACLAGLLEQVERHRHVDGIVIACFDDTGLDAVRCMVDAPVVGIGQSACYAASILGNRFTVVTTLSRSVPVLESNLLRYGLAARCAGIRATNIPVLELENMASETIDAIRRTIETAIREDQSDAIVLGCAGMTRLMEQLSGEYGLPVIDGLSCAVTLAEALVASNLRTSKAGAYG
ncbi:MAG: aspartate/glutamate racemase family protein [Gammaproteobacteria bacterium]|nr:aspartate/glutamate racemase family protein [Gammaproteobacteria bacterium]MYD75453.1 aspartate/glutamate racemase family protein [Gammaproteobacteria bacterium]MYJ51162.1 aspartate/glutamate racemase family protein [Gammaproteobacteria bacterium]